MTPLREVATINPRFDRKSALDLSEPVTFVPMAAVSESSGAVEIEAERALGEVIKGFTSFQDRDVLVAKITPCFENGKIAHARIPNRLGFGSTEFHVVRADPEQLNDRYLYHFLRQERVRKEGERKMTGSAGQRRVPKNFLEMLRIPLPPLPEQRRIAAILDKADVLRSKRREAIAKLDQLLQSVFLEIFGDPVTNPKGWPEKKTLGDVADIRSGITKGRKAKDPVRAIPYLAVANVQAGYLDLGNVKEIDATEAEIERYRLEPNDLLLTEGGDPDKLGRGALWQAELPESIHQNHVFRVRLVDPCYKPVYLSWQIASERGKRYFLKSAKQTTGIASINLTQLRGFPVLMPPVDLQEEFARRVRLVERQTHQHLRHERQLDTFFSSLQQRAFSGQLSPAA